MAAILRGVQELSSLGPRRRRRLKEQKRAEAGFGWRLDGVKGRLRRSGAG
ncbi:hypothetical protein COLO4_05653 [Corchorus olitorius]|uniref:Uncharacterized protein n=1 Tax=Corchorus olitorius TaxID=93759 RepID=A0A1R3KQA9_9ROSI|nr:hypothetical protein COLO4_05653 [Corchorus olitorius]